MRFEIDSLCPLCALLCASVANCFSLDREAFSISDYDLNVRIEPDQHRLAVRGKITLRNDSSSAQRVAVLQVSSSLDWRSITAAGMPLQFVSQPYTSDIDHTGALTEAIVTLPQAIAPKNTVELEIAYEGVVLLDATRLTRLGAPEAQAESSDWDQIAASFTAVRGAGYVAWYPIATESANLSEGNSLFETLGRWKARETASRMRLRLELSRDGSELRPELLVNNPSCFVRYETMGGVQHISADCTYQPLRLDAPAFVIADYRYTEQTDIIIHNLPGHDAAATAFADAAEKVAPLVTEWFGAPRAKANTADLPDPGAAPFESGALLLTPLASTDAKLAGLAAAHQLTHSSFTSPRPWIEEGLAHFAQVLYLEQQKGRQAALDYMGLHRSAFAEAEKQATMPRSEGTETRSLVNTSSEEFYRSKAMYVWWMLRDMVGDQALKKALAAYRREQDNEASYMPRLIQAQTQRDLEWFFDDWIYRDRGLPDFKIASAFSRKTLGDAYIVTVTVDNLGAAGGEAPVMVKFSGGEVAKRLEVRGKSKAVVRFEVPTPPQEVIVNDGSVPESDLTNNTFKIEAADASK
jgi:hypothetical protein